MTRSVSSMGLLDPIGEGGTGGGSRGGGGGGCWVVDPDANSQTGGSVEGFFCSQPLNYKRSTTLCRKTSHRRQSHQELIMKL